MMQNTSSTADAPSSALTQYLTDHIRSVSANDDMLQNQAPHVAEAVTQYLGNATVVDTDRVILLASRALKSMGEPGAARRLVLHASGLVQPAEWDVRSGQLMWVLDLDQMTVKIPGLIELTLFNCLRALLQATADLWDVTNGQGVLGLQNIRRVAARLTRDPEIFPTALESEIAGMSADSLRRLATTRGWSHCPDVLLLDLG